MDKKFVIFSQDILFIEQGELTNRFTKSTERNVIRSKLREWQSDNLWILIESNFGSLRHISNDYHFNSLVPAPNVEIYDDLNECLEKLSFSATEKSFLNKILTHSSDSGNHIVISSISEDLILELNNEIEKLRAEISILTKENEALKMHISTLENEKPKKEISIYASKPPIAQLATFLPIIYKNFWQEVSETDLALLADTFELPEVPRQAGGVQEPSAYTIERKKKAFLALSEDEQTKILDFCRNTLPRTLTIRPEMQAFVEI